MRHHFLSVRGRFGWGIVCDVALKWRITGWPLSRWAGVRMCRKGVLGRLCHGSGTPRLLGEYLRDVGTVADILDFGQPGDG